MSTTPLFSTAFPISPVNNLESLPTSAQDAWNRPIFTDFASLAEIDSPVVEEPAHRDHANDAVEMQLAIVEEAMEAATEQVVVQAVAPAKLTEVEPAEVEPIVEVKPFVPRTEPRRERFRRGETSELWGMKLDRLTMEESVEAIEDMIADRQPRYVITANLNFAMLLEGDESLQKVTDNAALVLADGQPLVWRSKIGSAGDLPERVAGSELIYRLAERAALRGWRLYFLGAEPGVANRCADALARRYPGLQIAGVQSPPYHKLSETETRLQRQQIIDSRADILFVAFGQPKGERWIHENYQELGVPVSIQIGASFDFVAGTSKRAPKVWQRLGMEWAYRMFSDPARLIPRYASNAAFLFLALVRDWRDYVNAKYGYEA